MAPSAAQGLPIGQTRLLTVLFSDLSGSVASTLDLDAEETSEFLGRVLAVMRDAVEGCGGHVNKALGDGVLALFGVPVAGEEDPICGIRAALQIRTGLRALGHDASAGIGTGEVFVDPATTTQEAGEATVGGRVVNIASRLQSGAATGQILVNEATYQLARHAFRFEARTLEVKGVAQPMAAYEVLDALPRPQRARGISGLRAPMLGRERELGALTTALAELRRGEGGVIAIAGQAGVGKSRLKEALREIVDRENREGSGPHWLEGRCLESGAATGYLPFRGLLEDYLGFQQGDDDEARRKRIDSALSSLSAGERLSAERVGEIRPLIGRLLSVAPTSHDAQALGGPGRSNSRTKLSPPCATCSSQRPGLGRSCSPWRTCTGPTHCPSTSRSCSSTPRGPSPCWCST